MAGIGKASQPSGGEAPDYTTVYATAVQCANPTETYQPANPQTPDIHEDEWAPTQKTAPKTGTLKVFAWALGMYCGNAYSGFYLRLYNHTQSSIIYETALQNGVGDPPNKAHRGDSGNPLTTASVNSGDLIVAQMKKNDGTQANNATGVFVWRVD